MATALLSSSEKEYIRLGVESDIRADGRKRLDFRPFALEVDTIPQAAGSARVYLGRTDILVSIKTDITRPALDKPERGIVFCSVDTSSGGVTGTGREQEERQRDDRNADMSTALNAIIREAGGLDLKALSIVDGKHCWTIFVDVLILGEDGNLMDAILLAVRSALQRTRLPGVNIEEGGEATEIVLSDDPNQAKAIDVSALPLSVTTNLIGNAYVVDASIPEEACSNALLLIAVNESGDIVYTKKQASGAFQPGMLADMIQSSQKIAADLFAKAERELSKSMTA
jgi:exosome complex component RRP42